MTISLEKIFFIYIFNNKRFFDIVPSNFFKNNEIKFVYNIIRDYMLSNREADIPSPKQIFEMISLEDREGIITKEILKSILTTLLSEYDEKNFIIPRFNAWILANKLKNGTIDIIEETRTLDTSSDLDSTIIIANRMKEIVNDITNTNFVQDDDLGSDFDNEEDHSQDKSSLKVDCGIPTLNHMLGGGWDVGTLNLIMASTSNGKCTTGDTLIKVKNKLSGDILEINFEEFYNLNK